MVEYLPEDSPARWHRTDGRPHRTSDAVEWRSLWALWSLNTRVARALGDTSARMPFDEMPPYPWAEGKSSARQTFGSIGDRDPEEALDYLLSLEM